MTYKNILSLAVFSAFVTVQITNASDLQSIDTIEGATRYLATQTSVSTRNGNTYDISIENPQTALDASSLIFKFGVPAYIQGDDFAEQIKGKNADDVKTLAADFAQLLSKGQAPESVDVKSLLSGRAANSLKQVCNILINTFLTENGITTEVVSQEVAAWIIWRQRLIAFKKAL